MSTVSVPGSPHEHLDRRIARLVARRYGVFTRAEVLRLGASRRIIDRRLASGRWERMSSGVYRLAGVPTSWRQSLFAECLSWGEGTFASHRAAAALRELPGFAPGIIELIVPRGRKRQKSDAVIHAFVELPAVDRSVVASIPVTTVARTLIDVAAVASAEAVEEALDDALRRGLVSLSRLHWRLRELGGSGRPGSAVVRKLIDARSAGEVPQSVFETRVLRELRRAGLPPPTLQHEIRDAGGLVAVVDFAYPEQKLAIEADGYRWHSGRIKWQSDIARRNRLTALGWRLMHITWRDLAREPERVMSELYGLISCPP